jgi:hypothetical protein
MVSASMLLASSGMLPDDLCAYSKSYELCARDPELRSGLAANPNDAALLTWPRHRDHEFAVLLGHKVFRAAG